MRVSEVRTSLHPPLGVGVLGLSLQVPAAFGAEPTVLRWLRITVRIRAGRILKVSAAMGAEPCLLRHFLAAIAASDHVGRPVRRVTGDSWGIEVRRTIRRPLRRWRVSGGLSGQGDNCASYGTDDENCCPLRADRAVTASARVQSE